MEATEIKELIGAAMAVRKNAYAPYSGFYVGAALMAEDGTVFTGANCENASYPAGHCAERAALAAAVSAGKRRFRAVAIVGGKEDIPQEYCVPCGICRQMLSELCSGDLIIIAAKSRSEYKKYTLDEMLPLQFTL